MGPDILQTWQQDCLYAIPAVSVVKFIQNIYQIEQYFVSTHENKPTDAEKDEIHSYKPFLRMVIFDS